VALGYWIVAVLALHPHVVAHAHLVAFGHDLLREHFVSRGESAGYVFSREQRTINRFLNELSFGGGAVNQTNIQVFIETMPFGGTGASGWGHYYGKHGYNALTHAKSVLVAPPEVDIDHLFPPSTADKLHASRDTWFNY